MSAFLSGVVGFFDNVMGIEPAAARKAGQDTGGVPCNMFSGFMIFGCRHGR